MAEVGLSTPLHLAANLLALSAAVGLAVMVVARPRTLADPLPRRRTDLVVAAGAVVIAVGHAVTGALVDGSAEIVSWLRAGGLAAIALGLSVRRLRMLTGPLVLVPVATVPPAELVAAVAGVAGAVRAAFGGRRTLPIGIGLAAWGLSQAAMPRNLTAAAWLTLLGAASIGWWLWHASARTLLAKFATTSVAILLAVVVLVAGTLSNLGSRDLVASELSRLESVSASLADEVSRQWREDAIDTAAVLRGSTNVLALGNDDVGALAELYSSFFRTQDFFVTFDDAGRVQAAFAQGEELDDSFLLQLLGSSMVTELLEGTATEASQLLTVGGEVVAVGGIALRPRNARAEDPVRGAVVTGRVADVVWASEVSRVRGVDVVVEVGESQVVASPDVGEAAPAVAESVATGDQKGAFATAGTLLYAAGTEIIDPRSGATLARIAAVSDGSVLADLEEDQARRLFVLALIGALLAGLVASLVTRRLVAPIGRLTTAAAAIREGNLDVTAQVESVDEVGVLGRTFNEMTASLAEQSSQLREAATVQSRLRARFEALTASMSDALVAVDPDGKVVTFNPAAERLVGRDVTEVLGLPVEEVLHGRGTGDVPVSEALGASDSEQVTAAQLLLERADGRMVPTAATAAPVHDTASGSFLGRVLVLRDVTRDAEVERMKTEFLSNVSHELRTPLTPIKGYAEVLARRDVGPDATRRFAGQILSSTSRLERIVGMIVDFAAFDSGRYELREEAVALDELVGETLAEWRLVHPDREFRRRVAKSLPHVLGDRAMLRRCLDELLDNAVKFSPAGGPVSVSASLVETDAGPRVRLLVRDRGVGIEPATAARVFSDFYQADASETRHYGGLGLGLALVRRIVDGVGGEVSVDATAGGGSTFVLTLPVDEG